ncbi:DNA alkylation repair protein [Halobacillus yeomjeoni]|uniref:DNA alkylation repair protein n=1 Tax=Halobacillus yeomjeoni TaxID=311194 RepID=A0A931MVF8_9BACI|nr:DNA alkylation repair protein [Halobacillus yeomjeoni]MBH0230341.1 DNA alkylation repair protein [Halobacillus yeomjeoni]
MQPYLCPNCKTNRSRFNLIEQKSRSVKINPDSGEIIKEYTLDQMDPFHMPYKGPSIKIQCGSCGLVEDEKTFAAFAANNKLK